MDAFEDSFSIQMNDNTGSLGVQLLNTDLSSKETTLTSSFSSLSSLLIEHLLFPSVTSTALDGIVSTLSKLKYYLMIKSISTQSHATAYSFSYYPTYRM